MFDDNSTHHMLDESPKVEVVDFNVGKLDYVDFLGVNTILSNSSNNTCEKFYLIEKDFYATT